MKEIVRHPILDIPVVEEVEFNYNGQKVKGRKGYSIAAALHLAGFPIHSHSLDGRPRSLECGIGKCGACEMLVDGVVRRICITKVDGVKEVLEIPKDYIPQTKKFLLDQANDLYHTEVAIIGAGPAGLAAREILNDFGVPNIVIDSNENIGGQFLMQTHQFFFFEKDRKYGGKRGFEIATMLAGNDHSNILLNSVVWDIFDNKILGVKNIKTEEIYYIKAEHLIVGTGAVPFIPVFENDDLPGVYTAAVVQKLMNLEHALLGKNILTVGAGNIGYLTSYQLTQAGANVVAIVEAQKSEGGFPVQANRVRRLGIPILTGYTLVKAIPNDDYTAVKGAVIAQADNKFKPISGTEKLIENIDLINICTGLIPDDQLLILGKEVFGNKCHGVGDAIRIGEGTSAVLRGKQAAFEVLADLDIRYNYDDYLAISKEYIDSQQHPIRVLDNPAKPTEARKNKPFVIIDCLYGFACNPCVFACPQNAISKSSTSTVPIIDYDKCTGCLDCVYQCPGLAIVGFNINKNKIFIPTEHFLEENSQVYLVDNYANKIAEGEIEKILMKPNKTNVARVRLDNVFNNEDITNIRGLIPKNQYPEKLILKQYEEVVEIEDPYVCHCEDITYNEILDFVGDRKFVSVMDVKHNTRLGMGPCRGKRCIRRLRLKLASDGITLVGDATPRGPLSNQILLGELYPHNVKENIIPVGTKKDIERRQVNVLIAGGGMAGSSLFRYFAEAGMEPVLVNYEKGSSWRNIAGGRPAFSIPELSDIARHNLEIFEELNKYKNINFKPTVYVNFAHDELTYKSLEASKGWSDVYEVSPKEFSKEISPYFNPSLDTYLAAFITRECWQANPGKTVDLIRRIGLENGGTIYEDATLISVEKKNNKYTAIVKMSDGSYIEFEANNFVNALGGEAEKFANMLNMFPGLYAVRHQAFITRRLPYLGKNGDSLDMLIDRRKIKGFSAVYGQQLYETGQIIGCASPAIDAADSYKDIKLNTKEFLNIISEVFCDWIPMLSSVQFQSVWSGYYTEPRMIIDPENGLFVGMRGQGFMLSQYLAKLYVDKLTGKEVPYYFDELKLTGKGLSETAFK
ncbi:MAG TPA: FAD-dependent oxidoreductase [Bacteroidales bacterium]|nr:FAD-dependent oxidoreductase [Bacteroidales bacterium]